ncbi:MAG: hydroxymethylbilane synthase [Parachlamydiaceae bacterium]|nr:hydroxymethylbilane synthase [Parachlamydiaceae bacterium]
MSCLNNPKNYQITRIKIAARDSRLSVEQVKEILESLQQYHPHIHFDCHFLSTIGDRDQNTSLRKMEKSNFFTKDIDELVLNGICQIGIHSAKDLPEPLTKGLSLICLTKGIDSSDSLVIPQGQTIDSLPLKTCIGTSSERREEAVKSLRSDFTFKDIRGTIEQRLAKMKTGEIGGLVVAEAALIRLNLTHLNRMTLPGLTTTGQGQLAILSRENDLEMKHLFICLDCRNE